MLASTVVSTWRIAVPFSDNRAYQFSETGIAGNAPIRSGVYGIFNSIAWIYVGEAGDMQKRLYEHYRKQSEQSSRIWARNPTGFMFEEVAGEQARKAREAVLIRELKPTAQ